MIKQLMKTHKKKTNRNICLFFEKLIVKTMAKPLFFNDCKVVTL